MTTRDNQIEAELTANELVLSNALADGEIASLLASRGYPDTRINECKALLETARSKQAARQAALGAQMEATAAYKEAFNIARTEYADFREIARAHYKSAAANPQPWQALGLSGSAPQSTEGFIGAAYATYANALDSASILSDLSTYGFEQERIEAARANVAVMETANQVQESAKGATKRAIAERDQAYQTVKSWMSAFKRITRRTIKDRPDLFEKLGL